MLRCRPANIAVIRSGSVVACFVERDARMFATLGARVRIMILSANPCTLRQVGVIDREHVEPQLRQSEGDGQDVRLLESTGRSRWGRTQHTTPA